MCTETVLTKSSSPDAGMESNRVVNEFRRYFGIVPAKTEALRQQAYRIRYTVYAEELGWEDKARFPSGYETDQYDQRSEACLLRHRESNQFIGCVRLIMARGEETAPFPFELAMRDAGHALDTRGFDADWRVSGGEISRVAVISQFRRRRHERDYPDNPPDDEPEISPERRVFPHIAIGLYLGAAALGMSHALERVFAIMEPKLARRLRTYGIEFEQVGVPLEHHGLRIPYCLQRHLFEDRVTPPIRALLNTFLEDLSK